MDIRAQSFAELGELYRAHFGSTIEYQADIARYAQKDTARGLLMAGNLALQAAADTPVHDTASAFFAQSYELLTAAQEKARENGVLGVIGAAGLRKACMPYYQQLILEQRLPDRATASASYESLLDATEYLLKELEVADLWQETGLNGNVGGQILGDLSEAVVTLLAQHNGMQTGYSGEWAATLALPHEDAHADTRPSSHWDVSVYTHYRRAESPQVTYKAQVKTSDIERPKVDEDIALVVVKRDLALDDESVAKATVVAKELLDESFGSTRARGRVEQRSLKVIDRLETAA